MMAMRQMLSATALPAVRQGTQAAAGGAAAVAARRFNSAREKLVPETTDTNEPMGHTPPSERPTLDHSKFPTVPGTSIRCLMKKEPTKGIWMETTEMPVLKRDHVLIRVKKAAICGTDVHIYNWDDWSQRTVPTPMITGHEYSGVVEAVGADVVGFKVGDRVTGEGHIVCGHCRNCRAGRQHLCRHTYGIGVNCPGSFAEVFALPASNAFKLPDTVSDEMASIMDPLGNAVHCALSYDLVGEDVLITGAGAIGIMAAGVCKQAGARHVVITDVNDYRLDLAKQCGADLAVNVSEGDSVALLQDAMKQLGMVEGFDVALEMSGASTAFRDAFEVLNHGAKVCILGIPSKPFPLDLNRVVFKGLELRGIYGREMYETWYKMASMLQSGLQDRLQPVITHRFKFDDFQQGFDAATSGKACKVVLDLD